MAKVCFLRYHFLCMNLRESVPLAEISWFRCGGRADYVAEVATKEALQEAVLFAQTAGLPMFFVGSGSNIVFADAGLRGIIIRCQNTTMEDAGKGRFVVGAGVQNAAFYQFARNLGFDFSGFFTVPGSIGGAVAGNSGIPGCEMQDYLLFAELFDVEKNDFITVDADYFQYSYRHSIYRDNPQLRKKLLIWEAALFLDERPVAEIEVKAHEVLATRKAKQPWGKTGGSFFKNPAEGAAGYFLEQVGAKKMRVGGAYFSDKHANFLMSDGMATQADIIALAQQAMQKVEKQFSVRLEPEVILLDERGEEVKL